MTALTCEALRDDIISLLYDDGELAERSRAREHLAQCVACRIEYADLKGVRKSLGTWSLPVPAEIAPARTTPKWLHTGFAAAAGLALGIGITTAGRGLLSPVAPAPQTASVTAPAGTSSQTQYVSFEQFQEALKAQDARHSQEIERLRQSLVQNSGSAPAGPIRVSDGSAAAFERMLRASEERQTRAFEARLVGLRNENDLQRQYDMAQVAAGLAYIDSRTGADAARTSELMKNLVRVTAKPQDR